MKLKNFLLSILILAIFLASSGCSTPIDQASSPTAIPMQTAAIQPAVGAPTQESPAANQSLPTVKIPVTWSALNLTGKFVFTNAQQTGSNSTFSILLLDLVSGNLVTLYQAPENAWIYFVTVAPDSKNLVMAYSPPPAKDGVTHQELYLMPLDGSAPPQLLFTPPTIDDEYTQPDWSADGKYIYFSHVNYQVPPVQKDAHYPLFEVYRMAYPGGKLEKLAEQAFWPRISADSSRLAFVSLNPMTGKNKLYQANADGSGATALTLAGQVVPDIIDAPIFSPDGQSLLFSAPVPAQSYVPPSPTWLERLLGISVASAHTVPSEWWSAPLAGGGTVKQLTHIPATGLFASISPDKQYIANYSGNGLFVMKPDGSGLTMLVNNQNGVPGTISWIP